VFVEVNHAHVGAFLGELHGHGATDPAVASGDDGNARVQLSRVRGTVLELWLRRHLGFDAGAMLLMLRRRLLRHDGLSWLLGPMIR